MVLIRFCYYMISHSWERIVIHLKPLNTRGKIVWALFLFYGLHNVHDVLFGNFTYPVCRYGLYIYLKS